MSKLDQIREPKPQSMEDFLTGIIHETYEGKTLVRTEYVLGRKAVRDTDDYDRVFEVSPAVTLASGYETAEEALGDLEALVEEGTHEREELFVSRQCLFTYTTERWMSVPVELDLPVDENGVVTFG